MKFLVLGGFAVWLLLGSAAVVLDAWRARGRGEVAEAPDRIVDDLDAAVEADDLAMWETELRARTQRLANKLGQVNR